MAASFMRLASEAPEKPMVRLATIIRSTLEARGLPLQCTFRIASRPIASGRSTGTRRSKRPGRSSAESSTSARLVAAITITPWLPSNPSISVRIWLSVCSRSSLPPICPRPEPARCRPIASISSIKMMHGAFFFASEKTLRTRDAPTPTNISTNSEPEHEMKGTPASPATARASSVLPVPGAPSMITPRGALAPSAANLPGFLRNSTTSSSSCLDWSQPATSSKTTPVFGSSWIFDLDLPISKGFMPPGPPPPPPPMPRRVRKVSPPKRRMGTMSEDTMESSALGCVGESTEKRTLCLRSRSIRSMVWPGSTATSCRLPSVSMASSVLPSAEKVTMSTLSLFTSSRNSE
mmetsp:Transcript_14802/g.34479  ORF Transcript_14802/g.34479 Transcript_14802/m.34479 type:complete len:349 (+) Transcript_14802:1290-2336(+)